MTDVAWFARMVLLALLALLSACSQENLLTKKDYKESRRFFLQGDAEKALMKFPQRAERGNFITTMERGYLSLIQGKPHISRLQAQAELLENRVRYHVSREAKTFFYIQTPEDYYASEHEVIWLHMLLSWGYSMQGKYSEACVEARVASGLLSLPWSPEGHFDDPAMRLFLASLWMMCGEWREAQVDLRAAMFMDPSLDWAQDLAGQDQPPAHLFVVLGGPGPEPEWTPGLAPNPLRSNRQVRFKLGGKKSKVFFTDINGLIITPQLSPDASKWYERHLIRESELHELILDSTYGGKAAVKGTWAGGKIAATTSLGLAWGIGGTALGAAIIHYSNSANAIEVGLSIAGGSILKGNQIAEEGYRESAKELKQDLDPSIPYRFVRYLPEYMWIGWSDMPVAYPIELHMPTSSIKIEHPTVIGRTSVTVLHVPDTATYVYR